VSDHEVSALLERAAELDQVDPLGAYRNEFVIEDAFVYLDGNSLGRLPKRTIERMRTVVEDEWAHELVLGWDHWLNLGLEIGDRLAPLIGASLGEVVVCDQTSVNLYKVANAGLTHSGRTDIITDRGNFPSDRYVLEAVATAAGGTLIFAPEDPSPQVIESLMTDSVGVVSLSHVGYRSGRMLDAPAITDVAHTGGALMLWDLAHSAGAVPVFLNEWGADLAVGCTYKYLNAGPGAPGFLFVRESLIGVIEQPITGWYAHADQFAMADQFVPKAGIGRFVVGTPSIVSMVGADEGINLTAEVGMASLRRKSLALTDIFIESLDQLAPPDTELVTPRNHDARGSQVTVRHTEAYRISLALRREGVIPDFRAPDLVRFGFTPLYTTFTEAAMAATRLNHIVRTGSYAEFDTQRHGVT